MTTMFTECMQLAPGIYVQASAQNFRLHRLLPWEHAPASEALQDIGDAPVTRQLMAGALYAALTQPRLPDQNITAQTLPTPSLLEHIYSLASSYQTTHATPPTMKFVAERLAATGQHEAASHCRKVAEEESGHDTLALNDLSALGLPAQDFVDRLRPKGSLVTVALFKRYANSAQPISVLGYAYALERMALFNTEATIAAIEQLIPKGIKATSCLRVHSAVGSDAGHVAESIDFIAKLPAHDRTAIARAAYETISENSSDYPGDAAMTNLLAEFDWSIDKLSSGVAA
jgi:hypothetical protein